MPRDLAEDADVCLIVEGAYPFVAGGVSAWTHALIQAQSHLRFALVAITSDESPRSYAYELPKNVVSFHIVPLHEKTPSRKPIAGRVGGDLMRATLRFQRDGHLEQLTEVMTLLLPYVGRAKAADFLDSEDVWRAFEQLARDDMPDTSFLHYFWSLRSLLAAFLSVMLAPLPPARVYHTISTGYAGLMAARARIECARPALLTEHGIYTNERCIEIASADWLYDRNAVGLALDSNQRTLKDLWTDCFGAYARATYAASEHIVTLFRGNQEMQIRDGAPPSKCIVIPNGIDNDAYGRLARKPKNQPPSIALIGRVVPIKDVKTYLRACALLKETVPGLTAYVLGPTDEDPAYYAECVALARELRLDKTVTFAGRVSIAQYLPKIDLNVLTSLSEAQPLVVLETGAASVPSVCTDVGACREMIFGGPDEIPALGAGGAIVPIGDAFATADAIAELLKRQAALDNAAQAMLARVNRYYSKHRMDESYRRLYETLLAHTAITAGARVRASMGRR